jgi:hypothetical protein
LKYGRISVCACINGGTERRRHSAVPCFLSIGTREKNIKNDQCLFAVCANLPKIFGLCHFVQGKQCNRYLQRILVHLLTSGTRTTSTTTTKTGNSNTSSAREGAQTSSGLGTTSCPSFLSLSAKLELERRIGIRKRFGRGLIKEKRRWDPTFDLKEHDFSTTTTFLRTTVQKCRPNRFPLRRSLFSLRLEM